MNNEEILDELISDGKLTIDLSINASNILVTIFYMNILVNDGLIEMDKNKLTVRGFDSALLLVDSGWLMSREVILKSLNSVLKSGDDDDLIVDLIYNKQKEKIR